MPHPPADPLQAPSWAHRIGAGVVTVEAAALIGYSLWLELGRRTQQASSAGVALGSELFLLSVGLLVAVLAWQLWRRRSWAIGGGVFCQLIALPMAWYMAEAGFWPGAVALGSAALAALVALLSLSRSSA
jgi:hypothetical protein